MKRNQYGDVILSKEEQNQMKQFRDAYQNGWSLETNDPYDDVEQEDFVDTYIRYFKKKRDSEYQNKAKKLEEQAQKRDQNFLQKIVKTINIRKKKK